MSKENNSEEFRTIDKDGNEVVLITRIEIKSSDLKRLRDGKLVESDFTQLPDVKLTMSKEKQEYWKTLRQSLRDLNYRQDSEEVREFFSEFYDPKAHLATVEDNITKKDAKEFLDSVHYVFINDLNDNSSTSN